jgi:hypothetical protein
MAKSEFITINGNKGSCNFCNKYNQPANLKLQKYKW